MTLDSTAPAAGQARYENYAEELAEVKARNPAMSEPWSWDDLPPIPKTKYLADTKIGVAAYLDEAGTPMDWCEIHDAPRINPKICMEWPRGFYNVRSCRFVDAVLVIGGNDGNG